MAADTVYDAIKAYLAASTASLADPVGGSVPTIRYENEKFDKPEPPSPFVAMAVSSTVYGQQSIGASIQADNRWDEKGTLWLFVMVPTGYGASRARGLAKQCCDLFRGKTLLGGNLEFMDAFIGRGAEAQEAGNWFELPVGIDWLHVEA
jgi:hypothetical protein